MQLDRRLRLARPWTAVLALVAMCMFGASAEPARSQPVSYFDEPLSPYGTWVEDSAYGRVWWPRDTPPGWRPYTYGRWVYTIEYGWVWVSEEPWGWVVYHYGHWVWTSRYGWVWVAGDVWGPAWVEWCYGNGYVGWTPMPPDPYWQGSYYYGSYECGSPRTYSRAVFVAEASFTSPRLHAQVVAPSQNATLARGSVNVTSYVRTGSVVTNGSIDVARLQAAIGQPIKPVRVVHAKTPTGAGTTTGPLKELRIFQPSIGALRAPKLDPGRPLKLETEPDFKGIGKAPLETGTFSRLPPSRSIDGPGLPPLGGPSNPGLGGGGLGGGVLGGVRGGLGR